MKQFKYLIINENFNIYKSSEEPDDDMKDKCDNGDINVIRISDQKEWYNDGWIEIEEYEKEY